MRLNWLRDLAAIPESAETALVDFKAREHGISSVIGYGKSAMLFFMLQGEIGRPAFEQGIRLFWQRQRFKTANWKDLESAFSEASGRNLSGFFRQWTMRPSSAKLDLALIEKPAEKDLFKLAQRGEVFDLLVPLRIQTSSGKALDLKIRLNKQETIVDTQTGSRTGTPYRSSSLGRSLRLRVRSRDTSTARESTSSPEFCRSAPTKQADFGRRIGT